MADKGVFSKAQLREDKRSGREASEVRAKFEWARPRQLIRLGGFYLGGKDLAPAIDEDEFVSLQESDGGLLELSFRLRDDKGEDIAVMQNNAFSTLSGRLFDLQVDAGATQIRIRAAPREILLDLKTTRKRPDEIRQMLEEDWQAAVESIQRLCKKDELVRPVFRDDISGPLAAEAQNETAALQMWRDERSGALIDSKEHLSSTILGWANRYALDDEGLLPVLDFRTFLTYARGHRVEIRDGFRVGRKGASFGFFFSEDSPPPGRSAPDAHPRRPFTL